jgi:hypothetical protein
MNPSPKSSHQKNLLWKLPICFAWLSWLLLTNCATISSYHQNINNLQNSLETSKISKAQFIYQRIQLDTENGVKSSSKWNAVMLRNSSMETIHDPHHYVYHKRIIEEALETGEISEKESQEFLKLAKEARNARSKRTQKRMMDRARLGYHR